MEKDKVTKTWLIRIARTGLEFDPPYHLCHRPFFPSRPSIVSSIQLREKGGVIGFRLF